METLGQAPALRFEDVSKSFRDFLLRRRKPVVNHLSFEVAQGETVGILGPNGSGKSTSLGLACGLLSPTAGRVRLFGDDPRRPSARKGLGYLPEENTNYPQLTARQMVRLHARLAGLDRATGQRASDELLERVGLSEHADRRCGTFSKGMARRLGLAQCLVGAPKLLILDEPTSGLDPIATDLVRDVLRDLRTKGVAVLLSSHLLAEVEDVCDRLIILKDGRLVAHGAAGKLLESPGRATLTVQGSVEDALSRVRSSGVEVTDARAATRSLSELYRDLIQPKE